MYVGTYNKNGRQKIWNLFLIYDYFDVKFLKRCIAIFTNFITLPNEYINIIISDIHSSIHPYNVILYFEDKVFKFFIIKLFWEYLKN